jgi:catechol 2,3-dioxygenase
MTNHAATSPDAYGIQPPGFRLPGGTRVGGVCLQVSDLDRSVAYYTQVLGLRVIGEGTDRVVLGPQREDRPLVSLQTASGVVRGRRGAFGLYHFAILLPGRAELARFALHLAALGVRPGMADHFVSEALYLWDPDGLGIEVYADRPQSAWRQQGRELVMTTEPLDVESLRAAGGARRWEGMPEGSTMGHVHLHVGGLEEAEVFYHLALGFDKTVWNYPGALFLAAGGYHHHVGTNVWAPGPAAREDEARLLDWDLVVPGREHAAAAVQSLRVTGYVVDDDRAGGFLAADPWGTRLRVVVAS